MNYYRNNNTTIIQTIKYINKENSATKNAQREVQKKIK